MALISPYEGENLMLQYMLGIVTPPVTGPYLRLFTSPIGDIARDIELADVTEVASLGEILYAAVPLTPATWIITTTSTVTTATYDITPVIFAFTNSYDIYGYYVTDDEPATTILWIEKFPDVFSVPSTGTEVKITPKLVLE